MEISTWANWKQQFAQDNVTIVEDKSGIDDHILVNQFDAIEYLNCCSLGGMKMRFGNTTILREKEEKVS